MAGVGLQHIGAFGIPLHQPIPAAGLFVYVAGLLVSVMDTRAGLHQHLVHPSTSALAFDEGSTLTLHACTRALQDQKGAETCSMNSQNLTAALQIYIIIVFLSIGESTMAACLWAATVCSPLKKALCSAQSPSC